MVVVVQSAWGRLFGNMLAVTVQHLCMALNGEVQRLGIELEGKMVAVAIEDGGSRNWEKGMI